MCDCKLCTTWIPLFGRIKEKLDEKDKKLFETFLFEWDAETLDGQVAQAKVEGEWPGWEWMKEEVPKHFKQKEHTNG